MNNPNMHQRDSKIVKQDHKPQRNTSLLCNTSAEIATLLFILTNEKILIRQMQEMHLQCTGWINFLIIGEDFETPSAGC